MAGEGAGALQIERVPCLQDNYSWLVHEPAHNLTAVVDPAEVSPVLKALEAKNWKLTHIFNTHHHWDHTGGNAELKERFACTVVGPDADKARIPGIDVALKDGETYQFGAAQMHVFDTPGHTRGHITLWFPGAKVLFPGDTLFALGCGRLFEGTPQQMWTSLSKLIPLPPETQSNAKFAVHADPDNEELRKRKAEIDDLRSKGVPTVPSLLGQELRTNPFLRPDESAIRKALGIPEGASSWEAFGKIRQAKDSFR
ncbi:hypothetical protein N2152v2_008775 [Parachlorella kessleri]